MNFNEAMQMLGTKLQGKYGHLGFKYKKSDKTLTRHSKNFTYMIAFSSFGGNTKDSISIEVCYIINTRPYDPYGYAKPDINTQPLFYSLRDNEIYLDIGNEEKINNCALPGFVDSKNEEKTERNAGHLVVSHSGGGMLRQGTRKGIRRTPANRGMRAHRIVKSLDISEDVCHGLCP